MIFFVVLQVKPLPLSMIHLIRVVKEEEEDNQLYSILSQALLVHRYSVLTHSLTHSLPLRLVVSPLTVVVTIQLVIINHSLKYMFSLLLLLIVYPLSPSLLLGYWWAGSSLQCYARQFRVSTSFSHSFGY